MQTAEEEKALRAIRDTRTVLTPQVIYVDDAFLAMEDLGVEAAAAGDDEWFDFGSRLGEMHQNRFGYFGYPHDSYLGIWDQKNTPADDWLEFFAENRVRCYLDCGKNAELLSAADRRGIERIIGAIGGTVPDQRPCLCHGDLWFNNVFRKADGKLYPIDPSLHYGLPEAD